jgi:ELWxxDGT repeat protein
MSGHWSYSILGRSVARWLSAGRNRGVRRPPVRPRLEVLERRDVPSGGPFLVKDINPGSGSSLSNFSGAFSQVTNVDGTLFFGATGGIHGTGLWKSNGTSSGTVLVKDIGGTRYLTNVNGTLFFRANDGTHGYELWQSNGTPSGTTLVRDIDPGPAGSNPTGLTNVNGALFFVASDGSSNAELWRSNGTSAGTVLVSDVVTGSGFGEGIGLTIGRDTGPPIGPELIAVNHTLFFGANDGSHHFELWKSDGTSAGTVLVKNVFIGKDYFSYAPTHPAFLGSVNGTLFFSGNDGSDGYELWKSDGTFAGTQPVSPVGAIDLTNVSGTLFFDSGTVWKSDGTSAGTQLVSSIASLPNRPTNGGTFFV